MLAEAPRAEVDACIAAFAGQRGGDGRQLVVRNGYHQPREVLTSAGVVEVTAPRVNDKRTDPVTGQRMRFSLRSCRRGRARRRRSPRCEALAATGLPAPVIEQIKREEAARIPLGRRGEPGEVAEWILRLADPHATWLTGQILAIDGGLSLT